MENYNKDIDGTWRIITRIYMVQGELKQGYGWYMENYNKDMDGTWRIITRI